MRPAGLKRGKQHAGEQVARGFAGDHPDARRLHGGAAAAQRVEHYEIAGYGNAVALAEELGLESAVELLEETLDEEKEADSTLTDICKSEVFASAPKEDGEEDDEEEYETTPAARGGKKGSSASVGRGQR